jgi:23S rRNA pseudouridine1911/1915/1917 synthase
MSSHKYASSLRVIAVALVFLQICSLHVQALSPIGIRPTRTLLDTKYLPRSHGFLLPTRLRSRKLWAKPQPASCFDIESILAYEAELEQAAFTGGLGIEDEELLDDEDDEEINPFESNNHIIQTYTIPKELNNKRIDAALASLVEPSLSRSACGTLITDGLVQMVEGDGTVTVLDRKSHKVATGDALVVAMPMDEKPVEIEAQDIPLNILYEDEHMIVLNKAAGMVVHPAAGNWDCTVVNALAFYLAKSSYGTGDFVDVDGKVNSLTVANDVEVDGTDGEAGVSLRPGIVHRLDKGTTGILVVAKTTPALRALSEAFAARKVKKTYLAITVGNPGKRVTIDKPIGRHPIHRQRMRVVPDPHQKNSSGSAPRNRVMADARSPSQAGRRALSFVDTLSFDGRLSVVQVRIETGRTHQIRVHLQDRHTPIYGDDVYGLSDWNKRLSKTHQIERPLLHAYKLEIDHPVTGEHLVFTAPMAEDMNRIVKTVWPQGEEERPDIF